MKSHTPKGQLARATIVAAAEALFVERGFHGTSMRDIAAGAELPLATVVYHFARKEALYGALLAEIAHELVAALEASGDFVATLVAWAHARPGRVKLLLRELLDNPVRVKKAAMLPLAPFLERATAMVGGDELAVLHVVGAISYVVAAWPTVERIVGQVKARELQAGYAREATAFARRALGQEEADHGSRTASPARPARARAPRARHHR